MIPLILGLSTRAIAESAVCSGSSVVTLDYFGDQDQKALVENHSLSRDYGLAYNAGNLLKASRCLKFDTVLYTSNLENCPKEIGDLARHAEILGNPPGVLRRVRDWAVLREFCRRRSIPHPLTLLPGEEMMATSEFEWLCKPAGGGGGTGIGPWDGRRLNGNFILQAHVEGLPASAAFVADGSRGVVIGLTRQLIGEHAFGAAGYGWCGNVLPLPMDREKSRRVLHTVEKMVDLLVGHFGLTGVGGMDFVIADGPDGGPRPLLLEINPRYTGAMELIERAYGLNIFALHLDAMGGRLPRFSLGDRIGGPFHGKGIVFSRQSLLIRSTKGWAAAGWKDLPFPGDRIDRGRPICSVFGHGFTHDECVADLRENADLVRRKTGDMRGCTWHSTLH